MSDLIDRIQKLVNQANGTDNDAEREAFLAKAETMMAAHKIDEAALRARSVARGMADAQRHEITDVKMSFIEDWDEFMPVHRDDIVVLAKLTGVRLVFLGNGMVHAIGVQSDIDYFRLLWTSTVLAFSGKLFPEWNRGASARKNIRAMAEAGYKWNWIWNKAYEVGQPFQRKAKGKPGEFEPVPAPPNDGGWMKRELKKAYDETGEEKPALTHGVRNYRNSYALGFAQAFQSRIWEMIYARQEAERNANGAALVLASDRDKLDEYLDRLYPPGMLTSGRRQSLAGNHAGAAAAGQRAARNADLSGGSGGLAARTRQEIG